VKRKPQNHALLPHQPIKSESVGGVVNVTDNSVYDVTAVTKPPVINGHANTAPCGITYVQLLEKDSFGICVIACSYGRALRANGCGK
jgi:hypothetical protein